MVVVCGEGGEGAREGGGGERERMEWGRVGWLVVVVVVCVAGCCRSATPNYYLCSPGKTNVQRTWRRESVRTSEGRSPKPYFVQFQMPPLLDTGIFPFSPAAWSVPPVWNSSGMTRVQHDVGADLKVPLPMLWAE